MKRIRRPDKSDFRYKLILGVMIFSAVLGLAFAAIEIAGQDTSPGILCCWVIWTVFYAVAAYCWTDSKRYERFEYILTPVFYGMLFLLLVAIMVGALILYIPKIMSGEDLVTTILALVAVEVSCGMFAYFSYIFFIRDYIVKHDSDED